jgi:uncharacterized membrane protein YfcA
MGLEWLLYPLAGIFAGLLAGLLGVGGGLVLVPILVFLLPHQGVNENTVMPMALATSLASIFLTGISSAYAHHKRGAVMWITTWWLAPGLLIGAALGGIWAVQLKGSTLKIAVAVFCVLVATQMLSGWPKPKIRADDKPAKGPFYSLAGTLIGFVSSIVGIGGGSLTVPLLVTRGIAPVRAVATSSACGVVIALSSDLTYASLDPQGVMPDGSLGFVNVPVALLIAVASIVSAPLGAKWAHRLPAARLKQVFAGFLLLVAAILAIDAM